MTAVPALVPFSGLLTEPNGKPVIGETSIIFLIFKDQQGGQPLFTETQTAIADAGGHFEVQLGTTLANGFPAELLSTGEARWLEVQPAGLPVQPRVLMASVPYALKAADSATLGGLPAAAFVLARLTGGGTSGKVTLNLDTTKVPLLAAATNSFTGNQAIGGNLSVLGNESLA